jgi:DNA mismatch repair protein MutL
MSKINVLDQNTINQIAAGEVIERPASVVKELVENSIDAGANAITVEIKEGGISFIRITDNGSGIEEEDLPLVFLRHSTSKIKTAEDLLSVTSLGFRGEALSSIAAIAQVELVTKTNEAFAGIRYQIAGGEEKELEHIGCPNGTTFIIRNIFFNTPARRKFLKSPVTEAGYISDLMERLAISHPNVSFKFINNNQIKLHTAGNNLLKDIIYNVYGRDISANLLMIEGRNNQVSMEGFVAKPLVSRGNRNYENYFINGRYIKSNLINKAIEEAFKPYTMSHRYPFTSLHLHIDSELIDVNVHPAKLEVRFKNSEELYQLIYHTLKSALEGREMIPDVKLTEQIEHTIIEQKAPEPYEINRRNEENFKQNKSDDIAKQTKFYNTTDAASNMGYNTNNNSYNRQYSTNVEPTNNSGLVIEDKVIIKDTEIGKLNEVISTANTLLKETSNYNKDGLRQDQINQEKLDKEKLDHEQLNQEKLIGDQLNPQQLSHDEHSSDNVDYKPEQLSFISEKAKTEHRIIGQVFSTYWIVEYGDKMFLIDQHAAHEKVLYEKTMKALREKQFNSQLLEPPLIITLSMREEEAIKKYAGALNRIGFEFEEFGGKEYAFRAVPGDLYGLAQQEILIELIDGLVNEVYNETPEIILEKIASLSCKAAVKGNHRITAGEADSLINQLLTLENPYFCPHGRPTIISMSKYELEKKFKRIV